jgi:hypothetical protein
VLSESGPSIVESQASNHSTQDLHFHRPFDNCVIVNYKSIWTIPDVYQAVDYHEVRPSTLF